MPRRGLSLLCASVPEETTFSPGHVAGIWQQTLTITSWVLGPWEGGHYCAVCEREVEQVRQPRAHGPAARGVFQTRLGAHEGSAVGLGAEDTSCPSGRDQPQRKHGMALSMCSFTSLRKRKGPGRQRFYLASFFCQFPQ